VKSRRSGPKKKKLNLRDGGEKKRKEDQGRRARHQREKTEHIPRSNPKDVRGSYMKKTLKILYDKKNFRKHSGGFVRCVLRREIHRV